MNPYISLAKPILACPACKAQLQNDNDRFLCNSCNLKYKVNSDGQLDLFLQQDIQMSLDTTLYAACYREPEYPGFPKTYDHDLVKQSDGLFPKGRILMGNLPKARNAGAFCVDIGCGAMTQEPFIKRAGYTYLGFDCENPIAPILGDAHAIPFTSESVELATSYASFEHFRNPWVVANEAYRVLKPGGYFHGWVAFIEGFHYSYYHMTHWGIGAVLSGAGFEVKMLEPDVGNLWFILHNMFPRMPNNICKVAASPMNALHRAWFSFGSALTGKKASQEQARRLKIPGGIMFIAKKPE